MHFSLFMGSVFFNNYMSFISGFNLISISIVHILKEIHLRLKGTVFFVVAVHVLANFFSNSSDSLKMKRGEIKLIVIRND